MASSLFLSKLSESFSHLERILQSSFPETANDINETANETENCTNANVNVNSNANAIHRETDVIEEEGQVKSECKSKRKSKCKSKCKSTSALLSIIGDDEDEDENDCSTFETTGTAIGTGTGNKLAAGNLPLHLQNIQSNSVITTNNKKNDNIMTSTTTSSANNTTRINQKCNIDSNNKRKGSNNQNSSSLSLYRNITMQYKKPWGLDLHYVTDNIIGMTAPRLDLPSLHNNSNSNNNHTRNYHHQKKQQQQKRQEIMIPMNNKKNDINTHDSDIIDNNIDSKSCIITNKNEQCNVKNKKNEINQDNDDIDDDDNNNNNDMTTITIIQEQQRDQFNNDDDYVEEKEEEKERNNTITPNSTCIRSKPPSTTTSYSTNDNQQTKYPNNDDIAAATGKNDSDNHEVITSSISNDNNNDSVIATAVQGNNSSSSSSDENNHNDKSEYNQDNDSFINNNQVMQHGDKDNDNDYDATKSHNIQEVHILENETVTNNTTHISSIINNESLKIQTNDDDIDENDIGTRGIGGLCSEIQGKEYVHTNKNCNTNTYTTKKDTITKSNKPLSSATSSLSSSSRHYPSCPPNNKAAKKHNKYHERSRKMSKKRLLDKNNNSDGPLSPLRRDHNKNNDGDSILYETFCSPSFGNFDESSDMVKHDENASVNSIQTSTNTPLENTIPLSKDESKSGKHVTTTTTNTIMYPNKQNWSGQEEGQSKQKEQSDDIRPSIPVIPQLPKGNCPASISTFLTRNHPDHYLVFNISSTEPSDRTKLLLNYQIVNIPWNCPGIQQQQQHYYRNENNPTDSAFHLHDPSAKNDEIKISPDCPTAASIPTLKCLLDICYAINAYTKLHPKNTAVIYCSNGKTRTGIAIAAFLKYSRQTLSSIQGFRIFCARSCPDLVDMEQIDNLIPPSLKTLFRNFDSLIECGGTIQKNKLTLRAITLQGIPVDDMPRIDLWDDYGLVYSSHNNLDEIPFSNKSDYTVSGDDTVTMNAERCIKQFLMWTDEEGFYRINKPICSDFLLLCRFGGQYAHDTRDPTKVIFRYANNASFLYKGPLKLTKKKVDIMRRYNDSVDDEDFLISFLFDMTDPSSFSPESSLECNELIPLEGKYALYEGLKLISQSHCINPDFANIDCHDFESVFDPLVIELKEYFEILQKYYHGDLGVTAMPYAAPTNILITLAMQLSNADIDRAVEDFLENQMKSLWKDKSVPYLFCLPIAKNDFNDSLIGKESPQCLSALVEKHGCDIDDLDTKIAPTESDYLIDEDIENRELPRPIDILESTKYDSFLRNVEEIGFMFDECTDEPPSMIEISSDQHHNMDAFYSPISFPTSGDMARCLNIDSALISEGSNDDKLDQIVEIRPKVPFSSIRLGFSDEHNTVKRHTFPSPFIIHSDDRYERVISKLSIGQSSSDVLATDYFVKEEINEIEEQSLISRMPDGPVQMDDLIGLMKVTKPSLLSPPSFKKSDQIDVVESIIGHSQINLERCDNHSPDCPTLLQSPTDQLPGKNKIADAPQNDLNEQTNKPDIPLREQEHVGSIKPCIGTETTKDNGCVLQSTAAERIVELKVDNFQQKDMSIGTSVSVVIGSETRDNCQIVAKSSGFYTIQVPVDAIKDGEIILTEKTFSGAAADAAAKALLDGAQMSIVPSTSSQKVKNSQSEGAIAAAIVIAKSKEDKALQQSGPPALKDDPEFEKYFKMLKVGLPMDVVKHAMKKDGKDPNVMDGDPNKPVAKTFPLKEDPEFSKYFKMLRLGMTVEIVKKALEKDGKDPRIMDLDHDSPLNLQKLPNANSDHKDERDNNQSADDIPLNQDTEFIKYFKMLKMGLPVGAVKNALQRDGKDPSIMDLDPNKSLKSQTGSSETEEEKDTGPPLNEDPEYEKYFKMLKMGLPVGAVKNALQRDGKDPSIMDLDPNKSLMFQTKPKKNPKKAVVMKKIEKKPKVRRKKIYWNAIDNSKVKEDSLWGQIQGMVDMKKLEYDPSEFESLFTETLDPSQRKKETTTTNSNATKQKKSVQVIEGKRGMNGGIILARLKINFDDLAKIIDHM